MEYFPPALLDSLGLEELEQNSFALDYEGSWGQYITQNQNLEPRGEGIVYVLEDADTGELLKVGSTQGLLERGKDYIRYANDYQSKYGGTKRNMRMSFVRGKLPVTTPPTKISNIESEIRSSILSNMEEPAQGMKLPWDNTKQRLGRIGPGVPGQEPVDSPSFTRSYRKYEIWWNEKEQLVYGPKRGVEHGAVKFEP